MVLLILLVLSALSDDSKQYLSSLPSCYQLINYDYYVFLSFYSHILYYILPHLCRQTAKMPQLMPKYDLFWQSNDNLFCKSISYLVIQDNCFTIVDPKTPHLLFLPCAIRSAIQALAIEPVLPL